MGKGYIDETGEYCESYTESISEAKRRELQPGRMKYAKEQLAKRNITIDIETPTSLQFQWKGERIIFHPYTGWHTGKSITDGRGVKNLLNQLDKK